MTWTGCSISIVSSISLRDLWVILCVFLVFVSQEEGPQVKRSSSPPHGAPKKRTAFIDITNVSPVSQGFFVLSGPEQHWDSTAKTTETCKMKQFWHRLVLISVLHVVWLYGTLVLLRERVWFFQFILFHFSQLHNSRLASFHFSTYKIGFLAYNDASGCF